MLTKRERKMFKTAKELMLSKAINYPVYAHGVRDAIRVMKKVARDFECRDCEALLKKCADKQPEALAIMRKEGFVIDNLDDRWQKLVFTLYTMLCEINTMAKVE